MENLLIDLRSDTVTRPTPGMLEAMFNARVGDDVFDEDPTVKKLEQKAADIFGKEAGLFCPSGTMTNQIGIRLQTQPQQEILCDKLSHIYYYEGGGIASNSGLSMRLLDGVRGKITPEQVEDNINPPDNIHQPFTSLVSLENTSNKGGGSYYHYAEMKSICDVARKHHLNTHLDGARIFNAFIETGDSPMETGKLFDTISVCLSKGLGAPVGSVLLSTKDNIQKAKRIRKAFGGGMRQSGYLAAAGLYALDHHITRLKEDHIRAKNIESTLKSQSYVKEILPVDTNIIVFRIDDNLPVTSFLRQLNDKNIKAVQFGKQTVRFVTHLDFTDDMLQILTNELNKIRV
ncbi:MAG: GntG family PLP-dependent aldolase [Bacteroidia bacterium]